jgi:iron complex transport system substrate-binding protein
MRRYYFVFLLVLSACTGGENKVRQPLQAALELSYAKGFRVNKLGKAKLVEVTRPFQNASASLRYLLVHQGDPVPDHDPEVIVITTPVKRLVCTSTTHLPLLDYLDASDRLVGFPNTDYISSEKIRTRVDEGHVIDLGSDQSMNVERLIALKPDLVMGYTVTGDYGQLRKIQELGVATVINAEYLEKHPLGRAEWIKFMGLLLEKESEANTVFSMIESNYKTTQALVKASLNRPTAMSGVVYGDTWFLPGGQNYGAQLLRDAGYHYLWESDTTSGFLKLSFESVFEKAASADYWIGVASFRSLDELQEADRRYANFKAFKDKHVYTYNARQGAKGGSEFLELGYLRPDIILKDLVKISRPELLPDYQLYFHAPLH